MKSALTGYALLFGMLGAVALLDVGAAGIILRAALEACK
jgi:hypothetical protein